MIKITIKEFAESQGIATAYQLQKALEIQPSVAAGLWKGDLSKIGISTLDKLCRVFECQPDKLLRYEPDASRSPFEKAQAAKKPGAKTSAGGGAKAAKKGGKKDD
jgi:DNA-binding Xre family transcriptional regulator